MQGLGARAAASLRQAWAAASTQVWRAAEETLVHGRPYTASAAAGAAEASSSGALEPIKQLKRSLIPENKNRNQARRMWKKLMQIKVGPGRGEPPDAAAAKPPSTPLSPALWDLQWNAQARKASDSAAKQLRDKERVERWRQRAAFKAAAAGGGSAVAAS